MTRFVRFEDEVGLARTQQIVEGVGEFGLESIVFGQHQGSAAQLSIKRKREAIQAFEVTSHGLGIAATNGPGQSSGGACDKNLIERALSEPGQRGLGILNPCFSGEGSCFGHQGDHEIRRHDRSGVVPRFVLRGDPLDGGRGRLEHALSLRHCVIVAFEGEESFVERTLCSVRIAEGHQRVNARAGNAEITESIRGKTATEMKNAHRWMKERGEPQTGSRDRPVGDRDDHDVAGRELGQPTGINTNV